MWERYTRDIGVNIKSYHADNGIYKYKKWVESCHRCVQGIIFAVVNAHHQKGMEERRTRELKELTGRVLIHSIIRWPKAVMVYLWLYALRMAHTIMNETPSFQNSYKKNPQVVFSGSQVEPNSKH